MYKLLFTLLFLVSIRCQAQIYLVDPNPRYFQDFDILDSFGTACTGFPAGWSFYEWGSAANNTYRAGAGSATTSDTYSFGPLRSRDRALGSVASGTLTKVVYGTMFVNQTGSDINAFSVAYRGEQWRRGGSGAPDSLRFYFTTVRGSRLSDSSTASWSEVPALCFRSVATSAGSAALNGNDSSRTLRATVPLMLHHGDTVFIRWCDLNAAGSDDGLAVDSFGIAFQNGPVASGNHPNIVSFSPDSNASGLAPDLSLQLRFDRAVRAGGGNIYIENTTMLRTDTVRPGQGQWRNAGREVVFTGIGFRPGDDYKVRIDSSAFDSSGYLSSGLHDGVWHFRIEALGTGETGTGQFVSMHALPDGRILIRSARPEPEPFTLRFFDIDGRVRLNREIVLSDNRTVIEAGLPPGSCYLVVLQQVRRRYSSRICIRE